MDTKLKNFINKWLNKYLEVVDPTNRNQCFDLVVGWCDELGLPRLFPHLYAYQIYTVDTEDKKKYFDKIENTADAYPIAGDIIVWSKSYNGTAGHTAVATGNHQTQGKSTDWFEAFSQNDPTGSPCILKKYSYNNVLGWLRPKKEFVKLDNYYKGIDLNNLDSVKVCVDTWHDVAVAGLYIKKQDHERIVAEKEATIQNLNQQINQLNAINTTLNNEKSNLDKQLKDCQNKLNENEALNNKIQEITDLYNTLQVDYKNDKTNWQLKEADYIRKITILEKKYQATKSSIKKLLIDYIFKNG